MEGYMKVLTKEQWRRRKRRRRLLRIIVLSSLFMIGVACILLVSVPDKIKLPDISHLSYPSSETINETISKNLNINQMLLTPNEYSRPQTPLKRVNSIVIHYTANPGTTAENNRNYFENLRIKKETSASAHFIIGLEGEIIQCIPLNEISFASNDRNHDTISIECCHPDETGKFNEETYNSLVSLVAWLCHEYDLDKKDIIRHYDVTGKCCPRFFVDHEDEWDVFKDNVMNYMKDKIKENNGAS
jgi:N-acetylmuramoyl-L-alanine amidase